VAVYADKEIANDEAPAVLVVDKYAIAPELGAVDAQVVPFEVRTLPDVLGAITCKADVPLPSKTLFAVSVAAPVPPLATGKVPVTLVAALTKVVEVVPVPPLAMGSVPVTPVDNGIFESVLLAPLIVLFVSVVVLAAVTTLLGVMIPDSATVAMIDPYIRAVWAK